MPAAGGHVQADIAQQAEIAVEPFVRIALAEQYGQVAATFVKETSLGLFATRSDIRPVVLGPVNSFKLGIDFDKRSSYPVVECCNVGSSAHDFRQFVNR